MANPFESLNEDELRYVDREELLRLHTPAGREELDRRLGVKLGGDPINHPPHYAFSVEHEPIKVIRAWGLSFALGNVVKYIARAGRKDPAKRIEDLKKARVYLDDEIAFWERDRTKTPEIDAVTRTEFDTAGQDFKTGRGISACDGRIVNY